MYRLIVLHGDSKSPTEVIELARAGAVLEMIPEVLARHADCERVEVHSGTAFLFAVDCKGNRLE
jgi:uncharacterized protein YjiK